MGNTIYGIFDNASNAEKAVGALLDQGVRQEDISVLTNQASRVDYVEYTNPDSNTAVTHRGVEGLSDSSSTEQSAKFGISTTTAADAGVGAVKGAEWGVGLGILAGIASLAIPGFGIVLGGSALATAIGAAVATTGAGAAAGAVTGYLKDQGIEGHVAENYEDSIKNGGALISVIAPSKNVTELEIRDTLIKYGATSDTMRTAAYIA